jgi:two-component system, NtrC family, response regulator HupR/HoxA
LEPVLYAAPDAETPAPASRPSVLVVDDEVRSIEALARTLDEEFTVRTASNLDAAWRLLETEPIDLVLCDQRMPGTTGVAFLREVRARYPAVARLILSGYADSADIISGINEAGIWHYLLKPWHPEQLLLTLRRAAEMQKLVADHQRLTSELRDVPQDLRGRVDGQRAQVRERFAFNRITRAPGSPMERLCGLGEKLARHDLSVLLTGESGTGKELLARAIHYGSPRADRSFVVENCGALPDELLESELFGHKRGSFTGAYEDRIGLFQQADGGTIFLDEIGETSPAFQVKLLRALQGGEIRPVGSTRTLSVDVRVIAATNRDLEEEVRAGRFREDLYYRVASVTLRLPPLRERKMDIALLAQQALEQGSRQMGRKVRGFTQEALDCFLAYRWPGNARELQNEVRCMLALGHGELLGADLLSPRVVQAAEGSPEEQDLSLLSKLDGTLRDRMDQLEAQVIKETMVRLRWNKTQAAQALGLSRVGLRAKLKRYGLSGR